MDEHLVVKVDQLDKSEIAEAEVESQYSEMAGQSSLPGIEEKKERAKTSMKVDEEETADEVAPLIGMAECRICHEEDYSRNLETPCACSGSVKYAHRKCVQHWCNEKGDITCEICHQTYQPGYTAPPHPEPGETVIDIGGGWQISGRPINLHDPRLLAVNEAEQRLLEAAAGDDDYNVANSGAVFCRSAALIIMALLLMHNVFSLTDDDGDDDVSAIFSLFLLRAVGFLLPCYIMIWAISILQRRRQRQEAAALARSRFAFVVQSGHRGLHFASTGTAPAPEPAPVRTFASVPVVTPRAERV